MSDPILKKGDSGDVVSKLQLRLNSIGANTQDIDGQFGDNTEQAVKNFQLAYGLTADGVVGQQTWDKLYEVTGSPNAQTSTAKKTLVMDPLEVRGKVKQGPDWKALGIAAGVLAVVAGLVALANSDD